MQWEHFVLFPPSRIFNVCIHFLDSMAHWTHDFSAVIFIWHWKCLQSHHFWWYCTRWMCCYWFNYSPMLAHLSCLEFLFILIFCELQIMLQGTKLLIAVFSYFRPFARAGLLGEDMSILIALNSSCQTALLKSFNHICCNQQEMLVLQHLTL